MNCQYCQKPYSFHHWDAKYRNDSYALKQYLCESCDTYVQVINDKISQIHWENIKVGKNSFKAYLFYNNSRFEIHIKQGNDRIALWHLLLSWDFIPATWSPQNVERKLKNLFPYL